MHHRDLPDSEDEGGGDAATATDPGSRVGGLWEKDCLLRDPQVGGVCLEGGCLPFLLPAGVLSAAALSIIVGYFCRKAREDGGREDSLGGWKAGNL